MHDSGVVGGKDGVKSQKGVVFYQKYPSPANIQENTTKPLQTAQL